MFKNILKNSVVELKYQSLFSLKSIIPFFLAVTVLTPFWFFFCLPMTIVYVMLEKIYYKFKTRSKPSKYVTITKPNLVVSPKTSRKYDAVVFGCTGLTGGLLVDYLANTYGIDRSHENVDFKWAITGRNE